MRNLFCIVSITAIVCMISCEQKTVTKMSAEIVQDTLKRTLKETDEERSERLKRMEEEEKIDSIRLASALDMALTIGQQMLYNGRSYREIQIGGDSIFPIKIKCERGSFFSTDYEHLCIRREAPNNILIDIYLVDNKKLKHVLAHDQWTLTYVSDSLKDVNGDGYKDYVVNWYGANGCCLKAFSDVYVYRSSDGTFTNQFEFINPTFAPKEKIVRGVCYGHPGETEMYKYRWKGEAIDTIEYIAYEKDVNEKKTGKFVTKEQRFGDTTKIMKRLDVVPGEYTSIEGYDWFLGFEEE